MDFYNVLEQVLTLLQRHQRVTYRAVQRQFGLDEAALADLTEALVYAHPEVRDDAGRGLVWMGEAGTASAATAAPVKPPVQAPLTYTPPYLAEKILTARSVLEGERKQVTVLFADLKGSMELLADRDPEEARQVLDPVLERMMAAVHRYEGTVNQVMGDGIMALFGAPIAHEDHAVRACYAALAMQATVTRYGDELQRSQGVPVQIRVGLHSGAVVVRGINSSLHMDYTAVGQTTHLAARMEQMAKPGSVLITVEALRLAEGFIQVETLGPVMVKGLADPVEVFELIGASSTRTRLQAFAARGLTRFVGRQPELVALRQALERAGTSHGQVVAVIGEPGVGKTRLIYEFIQSHYTHNWLVLESSSVSYGVSDCVEMHQNGQDENVAFFWHQICCGTHLRDSESLATARDSKKTDSKAICSLWMPRRKSPIFKLPVLIQFRVAADTYGKATAYLPVRDLLKAYFQIDDRDDGRKMREKLTGKLLTLDTALGLTLPAFLALLDLPVEDRHWQDLDPTQRRQRTLTAIKQLLLRESQVQPLLLVFENLHWLDTETQAILDSLIDSLPTARLLLLVTYRPEYQHAWGNKTYYTQLRLDPLPTASAEALLQALLGDDPSLVRLKQLVIERTEGNPFFLEESVRALVETGMLVGERGAYRLGQDPPTIQVAATVQAVLAARIDRLPPEEKRLLQTAAVIGTEVPFALLQAIVDLSEEKLRRGLGHLLAAEFLYETSLFPALAYTFKHALTHEVAYGSLLQERRRTLHARIVEAIERRYADRLTEQVEQLARHAVRGEVWDKAVTYCQQAGARAYDHAAFHEAVTAFEQALQALAHLPVDGDTQRQAIELHLALGFSLGALGEPRRRLVLLGEAEALARALDDQARLVQVLAQMTVVLRRMGDFDGAIAAGQEALEIAAARGDSTLHMQAALYLGMVYYDINDFGRAAELHRRNVEAVYRESGTLTLSTDMQIRSQAWLARSLGMLGAFAEGRRHGEEALRLATREGRGETSIVAHTCLGHLYLTQGDLEPAIRVMEQGLALWRTSGHRSWLQLIMANLSVAYALQGRLAEGRALLEEWISGRIMGSRQAPQRVVWLSQICDLAGHSNEAWQHACQALDLARQQKVRGDEAFALHQLGVVHTHADPPDVAQAEAHYQQALALAEELGMRPLVAHCHRGLGMLYAATGQQEQARSTLSTAIAMYRDMDMTFWLPETEAVPAQVEGR